MPAKKKAPPKKLEANDKEVRNIALAIQTIMDSGYANHRKLYRVNFIRGMVFGVGSALGASILIVLLAWVLSLFSTIPILGDLADNAQETIEASQQ